MMSPQKMDTSSMGGQQNPYILFVTHSFHSVFQFFESKRFVRNLSRYVPSSNYNFLQRFGIKSFIILIVSKQDRRRRSTLSGSSSPDLIQRSGSNELSSSPNGVLSPTGMSSIQENGGISPASPPIGMTPGSTMLMLPTNFVPVQKPVDNTPVTCIGDGVSFSKF